MLGTSLSSEAVDRPGDDPIFALDAEARRRAAAGERIVNATLGALHDESGALDTLPTVIETLRTAPPGLMGYAPIAGASEFLGAVVRDLFGGTALEELAVSVATPGGTGACYAAIVNFLEPGQKLLTTSFYWSPYSILAQHAGRGVQTFSMLDGEGRFDAASMERELDALIAAQGRALIILNTPCQNPTGYSLDDEDWQRVVGVLERAAERAPITLLLDNAYARFAPAGSDGWRRHVERLAGRVTVLVAWTASKSFAMYGARVGALVAVHPDADERKRIFNAASYSCRGTWSNGNHLGQWTVGRILGDPELRARTDRERSEIVGRLDRRVESFKRLAAEAGLEHPRYEGGFFVCAFTDRAADVAAEARARGTFVVPLQGAVRIALCSTALEDIPFAVESVHDSLREIESR